MTTASVAERTPSASAERSCRIFSLAEIQSATGHFNPENFIAEGGFGKVYKGIIDEGQLTVAMKRRSLDSGQGEGEFLTEIETASSARHVNLVSLIGYCSENGEMILVYEYIPNGTLANHLYRSSALTWKQRLNICIGAGRGMNYLHTGTSIIHRDLKPTNILLDEDFTAKVSDFGLAKHFSPTSSKTHVSTEPKGTTGYIDPSYHATSELTKNSDTYSFGVVLLEVLTGRKARDTSVDDRGMVTWAKDKIRAGRADQIVALNLRNQISKDCLKTFVGIAQKCLSDKPKERPTMAHVLAQLELALQQQDRKATSWFLPSCLRF